jgi:hypothetical protein
MTYWEPDKYDGYHVVPKQLIIAADELISTGNHMDDLVSLIEETRLGEDDLGILGKEADDAPGVYNDSLDKFVDYFQTLRTTLVKAGEILSEVAQFYAAKDDEYYKQFNRIAR